MRVVAIVVLMLVLTTPSKSSQSCMTKTEARQHFGWVHIYWQGKYRCWDATPIRQHHLIDKVQQKIDQPKWHEATPVMLPDQEPLQTQWVEPWVDIEPPQLPIVARGVDIVQVAPPPTIEREPEPMVTPPAMVVMVIISLALTLAIVEVLFGGMIYQRVASKRNTRSAVFWKKASVRNRAAL
jgi:hypothetical protein